MAEGNAVIQGNTIKMSDDSTNQMLDA